MDNHTNNPIEIKVNDNNIVNIAIIGDLLDDKIEKLTSSLYEATQIIRDIYSNTHKRVKVMIDLSNFNGKYTVKSFNAWVNFADNTKQYAEKSAVFGGSNIEKMAAEMVITVAGRTDSIKIFRTKEEALVWLK